MAGRSWEDPRAQRDAQQQATASWDRIRALRADPGARIQAQALSTMSANYPWMRAGVAVPLVRQGVAPDSPVARTLATEEAKANKRKHGFFGVLGDLVPGPSRIGHDVLGIGRVAVGALNFGGDVALTGLKGLTRYGSAALQFPMELATAGYRDIAASSNQVVSGAVAGAGVGAAGGAIFGGIGALPGAIGGAVVGGVAGGVSEMQDDEITSQGVVNPLAQTTLGQVASRGTSSVGSGYFVGGEARLAAERSQRAAASINGHALTPGRQLATAVTEPGTAPYRLLSGLMDASVAWKLDPAALAGQRAGAWRKARQAFVPENLKAEAGLVEGARKAVLPERIELWKSSRQGTNARQWLADTSDFETIRQQLPRVDVRTVMDLTNASTLDDVDAVLDPALGLRRGLEQKPRVGGRGAEVRRSVRAKLRTANDLPSGVLDFSDPTEAVHQFHLLQRNANIPGEVAGLNNRRFAEALLEGTPEGYLNARKLVRDSVFGGIGSQIDQSGVAEGVMRKLSRQIAKDEELIYRGLTAEDGTQTAVKAVSWGGKSQGLPTGGILADFLDTGLEIDRQTIRDIRGVTSKWAPIMTKKGFKLGVSALDHLQTDLWKPLMLIRGAWTTRVIGEEQVRMAASGRESMFNHPLSFLAWAMDDDSRIGRVLQKLPGDRAGRGMVGIQGERFAREGTTVTSATDEIEAELRGLADDYGAALNIRQQAEGWYDGNFVRQKHRTTYAKGEDGYYRAWAERLDQLHHDPVTRSIAQRGLEDTRIAFSHPQGDLASLRADMVRQGALLERSADVDAHLANAHRNVLETAGAREVPVGAQAGLPGMSPEVVGAADPAIHAAIREGALDGIPMRTSRGEIDKEFVAALRRYDSGPESLVGAAYEVPRGLWQEERDRAVQWAFSKFMAEPSAKLSRSPTFRQTYWDEAGDMIYQLDADAQATLLRSAAEAKLPKVQIRKLEQRAKLGVGDLSLEQADTVLKGRALDATRDLLYDTAQRGQLSDVLRLVMPFMEAQKEVMKVWARIGTQNPAVPRRAQQVIQGARGSGFFHTDEQSGEEMFTFPGSEYLTEKALGMLPGSMGGIPVRLEGRVQGLNMFGSGIMPGMGPVVQLPTRWLLPDKPEFDELRQFIDPFGATGTPEEGVGILEQNLPAYMTKLFTAWRAPESDRVFANTVKDVWASGLSAGIYSSDTPEDIKNGLEDAKNKARGLYAIRGLASVLGAPTAPTPEMMAKDKDGHWLVASLLADDLRKMQEDDYDTSAAKFLEKYGNNAAAYLQAKSFATTAATPTTENAASWLRNNQDVAEKYPEVAGLFAPGEGDFSYTQYLRNIQSGATVSLTPEQYVEAANDKIGKMIFYNAKNRFGAFPSKPQREWLSELRQGLREELPGFDKELPGKPNREAVIREFIPQLEKAVKDPALKDNDVARATQVYLAARRRALSVAEAAGRPSFNQAKDMAHVRDWLRAMAQAIQEEVSGFKEPWERVFDQEMVDDTATPQQQEVTTGA